MVAWARTAQMASAMCSMCVLLTAWDTASAARIPSDALFAGGKWSSAAGTRHSPLAAFQASPSLYAPASAVGGVCSSAPVLGAPLPLAHTRTQGGMLAGLVAQYRGRGGRGRGRRMMPPPQIKGPPMNSEITFPEMRVVVANPDGKDDMLGVLTREEALAAADERGVDLVLMSPDANPPVCKIINYDKLRYENEKKEKMKKKNQKQMDIKEVKLSYKIDVHDYDVRKRAAVKFLTKGDKVKASIRFKGREMAHKQLAQKTLLQLCADCEEIAVVEKRPSMEGRMMQVIMAPNVEVLKAAEKSKADSGKKARRANKNKKKDGDADAVSEDEEDDVDLEALNAGMDDGEDEEDEGVDYDLDSLSVEELGSKIEDVGDQIRELKSGGADKDVFSGRVDELLSLKARYQEVAGSPWVPKTPA
eukprot:CAMPEP_0173436548 /NCGR_PEP_ID=MMETSP1357-20121228/16392_1 /TAXON_ID=77926 /ORGANISM="Hemiselmis rufescens, Strain PCC563" /LENGTH=417 /DNA_ID=CAMNT_0014401639 /DNA_START=36 /DNA_END=1289 /DNA_ORIENTATION=+